VGPKNNACVIRIGSFAFAALPRGAIAPELEFEFYTIVHVITCQLQYVRIKYLQLQACAR